MDIEGALHIAIKTILNMKMIGNPLTNQQETMWLNLRCRCTFGYAHAQIGKGSTMHYTVRVTRKKTRALLLFCLTTISCATCSSRMWVHSQLVCSLLSSKTSIVMAKISITNLRHTHTQTHTHTNTIYTRIHTTHTYTVHIRIHNYKITSVYIVTLKF